MKLDKSHIGKYVRRTGWSWPNTNFIFLEWVGQNTIAGTSNTGSEYLGSTGFDDWEIVENPKKPSQRIEEIRKSLIPDWFNTASENYETAYGYQAILRFLDEEMKNGKNGNELRRLS